MLRTIIYFEYWQDLARRIAVGKGELSHSDIVAISEMIDFTNVNPSFLPGPDIASKSLKERKLAVARLARNLWGLEMAEWLEKEKDWLLSARIEAGNTRDDGKEDESDLVCPEILVRIYTVAYLFYLSKADLLGLNPEDSRTLRMQALHGLNLFIQNAVFKGYSRVNALNLKDASRTTLYTQLIGHGISVGCTGKFLPNPEISLPIIITLLHKESLCEEVYQK
jgi:hypothetical protein